MDPMSIKLTGEIIGPLSDEERRRIELYLKKIPRSIFVMLYVVMYAFVFFIIFKLSGSSGALPFKFFPCWIRT